MEAWIERSGEVVIIHLRGKVNYDANTPFRDHCAKHLRHEKVLFNFRELQFVGSIGITDFVATLSDLTNTSAGKVKFCGVGSEFRRLFEASPIHDLQIFDSLEKGISSFHGLPVTPLPRLSVDDPADMLSSEMVGAKPD